MPPQQPDASVLLYHLLIRDSDTQNSKHETASEWIPIPATETEICPLRSSIALLLATVYSDTIRYHFFLLPQLRALLPNFDNFPSYHLQYLGPSSAVD